MKVKVKKLRDVAIPGYKREGDAGLDLSSAEDVLLKRGQTCAISTGLAIAIPEGYSGFIWDRSGLACNNSIKTMGGVIDSNYRGEIKVIITNLGNQDFKIEKGMRIAQLIIKKVEKIDLEEVDQLDQTNRNQKGFGSSGLK